MILLRNREFPRLCEEVGGFSAVHAAHRGQPLLQITERAKRHESNLWLRILPLLGDCDFTPHGLRHTFASLHLARGTNLKWIQHMGG
jgi:integrase